MLHDIIKDEIDIVGFNGPGTKFNIINIAIFLLFNFVPGPSNPTM